MAPFGVKLWENAFQTIPDIQLFDAPKNFSAFFFSKKVRVDFFFKKVAFWRSYGFLDVIGRCALKNDPRSFDLQLSTTFGRGVKVVHTIFLLTFDEI